MASTHKHTFRLRIRRASQLVTVCSGREAFKTGADMRSIGVIEDGTVVVGHDGLVHAAGREDDLLQLEWYRTATFETDVDGAGKSVVPGLIDGHTHPVWSGDRVHEFAMKIAGATYMDIHKQGGGIGFTVRHTRESSEEELRQSLRARLDRMLRCGTTLVEAKSGYGLECCTEIKMLKVIHDVAKEHSVDVVSTFLGAHSVPQGTTAREYAAEVVREQIPAVVAATARGEISPSNIDVFYEKGVFEGEETRRIFEAGKAAGLSINFHGDELNPMGAGELGAEVGALAISHLEEVSDAGIAAMAEKKIFGVLLPTTAYVLRINPPPARKLIDAGVPVCLGSDFNPNAHCLSMPFVMNLACVNMRLTMEEALVAATINCAASLQKSDMHGSIEIGKYGNLVVIDSPRWEHLVYELVDPPIGCVIVRGRIVHRRS